MSEAIRIGFIGCGTRVTDHYLKMIPHVGGLVVTGFITKTDTKEIIHQGNKLEQFTDIPALAAVCDLIFVCTPYNLTTSIVCEVMKYDVHIVVETPIYDYTLVEIAKQNNAIRKYKISVAENWPFRPSEVLKQKIISSGLLGKINTIINDFRGYEYHAFAMMRSYDRSKPLTAIGSSFSTGDVVITDATGIQKTLTENWDVGLVTLESETRLIHNFNSIHSRSKTRGTRSLRVMCTNGSISSDDFDNFVVEWDINGVPQRSELDVYQGMLHREIAGAGITVANEDFMWRSPICDFAFNEEDLSIYNLLQAIRDAIHIEHMNGVVYSVEESYIDAFCVNAIRQSHGNIKNICQ